MATKETKEEKEFKEMQKKISALSKSYSSLNSSEFIRSGSVVLDALMGGGIPKGTFIAWSAEEGCGKSTGALHIARVFCMQGKKVLYLDYEGGVNTPQLEGIGLTEYLYDEKTNPEGRFFLYQVMTYRDADTILDAIMDDMDLVIIDSATAMMTEKTKGASSEDIQPGIDSRVMSIFLKRYKAEAVRNGVTWLILNQLRTKIATGYGQHTKEDMAGGKALRFYPDILLFMKKAFKGVLEREEETITGVQKVPFGSICTIWADKNRYERPKIPLRLAIIFGKGISNAYAYYDMLDTFGCIKKSGAWYTISIDEKEAQVQGVGKVIDWIEDNRNLVKNYINEQGGYRLLLEKGTPIDIDCSSNDDDTVTGEFTGVMEDAGEADMNYEEEPDKEE